ncbi:hypothetical protein D9615_004932 [Tricholomella constricta]|uniref:Uncharacterized protein n=1 Tax=Tricholomella constricta TaxID=117010 RepID=A0A8H5M767_9AGAR|nr:hypothetical protein D9615_004932 [Tricholomella constricta]
MEIATEIPNSSNQNTNTSRGHITRPPRNRQRNAHRTAGSPTGANENEPQPRQRKPNRGPPRGDADGQARSSPSSSQPGVPSASQAVGVDSGAGAPRKRNPKRRNPQKQTDSTNTSGASRQVGEDTPNDAGNRPLRPPGGAPRRGAKFNAGLTEPGSAPTPFNKPANRYRNKDFAARTEPEADDLTSRLIHALRTPPYPDCPICFSSIHPAQRTWSCSPSIPVIRPPDAEGDEQQYCWTTFHVKCIGEWAAKSVKNVAEAWRARGEEGRMGDWRCPGCQAKREVVPSGYWCVFLPRIGRAQASTSCHAAFRAIQAHAHLAKLQHAWSAIARRRRSLPSGVVWIRAGDAISRVGVYAGGNSAAGIIRAKKCVMRALVLDHSTVISTNATSPATLRTNPKAVPIPQPSSPPAHAVSIPSLVRPPLPYRQQPQPPFPPVPLAPHPSPPAPPHAVNRYQAAIMPAPRPAIPAPVPPASSPSSGPADVAAPRAPSAALRYASLECKRSFVISLVRRCAPAEGTNAIGCAVPWQHWLLRQGRKGRNALGRGRLSRRWA